MDGAAANSTIATGRPVIARERASMNPCIRFDPVKTPAKWGRIAERYDVSSEEVQPLMAGKKALMLLGPTTVSRGLSSHNRR